MRLALWLRLDLYLWCVFMGVWLLAAPFSRKISARLSAKAMLSSTNRGLFRRA